MSRHPLCEKKILFSSWGGAYRTRKNCNSPQVLVSLCAWHNLFYKWKMLSGKGRQQLPPTTISSTTQSLTIIPMYAVWSDAITHELSVNILWCHSSNALCEKIYACIVPISIKPGTRNITDGGLCTEIAIAHFNVTYVNLERIICDTLKHIILQALALLHKESVTSKPLLQIFSSVFGKFRSTWSRSTDIFEYLPS